MTKLQMALWAIVITAFLGIFEGYWSILRHEEAQERRAHAGHEEIHEAFAKELARAERGSFVTCTARFSIVTEKVNGKLRLREAALIHAVDVGYEIDGLAFHHCEATNIDNPRWVELAKLVIKDD